MSRTNYTTGAGNELAFGEWLQGVRRQQGHTQQSLADQVHCSWEMIRRIEAGSRRPSEQLAELLAQVLRVPSEERQAVVRWARTLSPANEPVSFPRSATTIRNNLPNEVTSFVGREKDLAALCTLLRDDTVRLVSLTGVGGCGKTRLALKVTSQFLDRGPGNPFPDGVYFVNLAPIVGSDLVVPAIAQALGVQTRSGQTIADNLKAYLREKRVLLLLDNFEQLVAAAPVVADLLAEASGLKALVTSRERLRLQGEHNFPVAPLSVPHEANLSDLERLSGYEAVQLFVDRATAHRPDFRLTTDNGAAVAGICARLDGLPLPIELAAARVQILSARAILVLLENRLKLLSRGARDLPSRQQTLRNTIQWSYDLLNPEEQKLFRRLSVFQGGRTMAAIEAVCDAGDLGIDLLDGIESLVNKSLLERRREENPKGEGVEGEPRFWMLETVHEFAREKLGESGENATVRERHLAYFTQLAEEAEPHLRGAKQVEWIRRLEVEHNNLRAALRWATEAANGDKAGATQAAFLGLRLAGALWRFWHMQSYFNEGKEQLADFLALEVLVGEDAAATEGERQTDVPVAAARVKALVGMGMLTFFSWGESATARCAFEEALAISRELGDRRGVADSLNGLGLAADSRGYDVATRPLFEESLAIRREIGDKRGIGSSLNNLAHIALYGDGDITTARSLFEESLMTAEDIGDKWGVGLLSANLAGIDYEAGNYAGARALFERSLTISRELGDKWSVAVALIRLAWVELAQGDYVSAGSLCEESLVISRELGITRGIAGAMVGLAHVARQAGNTEIAWDRYTEGVKLGRELDERDTIAITLAGLGGVAIASGQPSRGARLLAVSAALLESMPSAVRSFMGPVEQTAYEQDVAAACEELGEEEFARAWAEGRTMRVEEAIEYASKGDS